MRLARLLAAFTACLLAASATPALRAAGALVPQPLSQEQAAGDLPARLTGMLTFNHGQGRFYGSATFVRRHLALTAAHALFDAQTGWSTALNLDLASHRYNGRVTNATLLAGYQEAATKAGDNATLDVLGRDLGVVFLQTPAPDNFWAEWAADPDALTDPGTDILAFGWHIDAPGSSHLYVINPPAAFRALDGYPGYYEKPGAYLYPGMSGGPVYAQRPGGAWLLVAENVSSTPAPTSRGVFFGSRAIDAEARRLLINWEYAQPFLLSNGKLKGPAGVAAAGGYRYKVGVIYSDGYLEQKRYDELTLSADNPDAVAIQKLANDRFWVSFSPDLPSGAKVQLRLGRDTDAAATPLKTLTVTVQ